MMTSGSIHQESITSIYILVTPNELKPLMYTANINRFEMRNRQQHSKGRRIQYPTFNNGQVIQKKISKETVCLNNTTDQKDLTDIQIFYRTVAEYAFFLSAQRKFSRINKMLGHRTNLNRFKKTEIISSIFSNHNDVKVGISNRRKIGKLKTTWKLSNTLPNN